MEGVVGGRKMEIVNTKFYDGFEGEPGIKACFMDDRGDDKCGLLH